MDDLIALILSSLSFVIGGGVSKWLDSQPIWQDWHPGLTLNGKRYDLPFVKSTAAFLLSAGVLLVLVTGYQMLPSWMPHLSADAQAILVMFGSALGAFIRYQNTTIAKLKAQLNGAAHGV